jgi:hypothetical protein
MKMSGPFALTEVGRIEKSTNMSIHCKRIKPYHPVIMVPWPPPIPVAMALFQKEKKVGLIFFYPVDKTSAI